MTTSCVDLQKSAKLCWLAWKNCKEQIPLAYWSPPSVNTIRGLITLILVKVGQLTLTFDWSDDDITCGSPKICKILLKPATKTIWPVHRATSSKERQAWTYSIGSTIIRKLGRPKKKRSGHFAKINKWINNNNSNNKKLLNKLNFKATKKFFQITILFVPVLIKVLLQFEANWFILFTYLTALPTAISTLPVSSLIAAPQMVPWLSA